MKVTRLTPLLALAALALAALVADRSLAAIITFDDFNVGEGHFASVPTFSGSNSNIAATSTADRITTASFEGDGNEQLVVDTTTAGNSTRLRFLSGVGTAANNINFATSAGVDGWIGLALKTDSPGWNAQLWIEPGSSSPAIGVNGGVPKNIVADSQWHVYQWNLDDTSGGPNGWGSIAGIIGGVATVGDGNHTIDSVVFRNAAGPAKSTIYMDWVVRNDAGQIPEPASWLLMAISSVAYLGWTRRRIG